MEIQLPYIFSIRRQSSSLIRITLPTDTVAVEMVILNGIMYTQQRCTPQSRKKQRLILSARERVELAEKIDDQYRSMARERSELPQYQIFAVMAEESEVKLGYKLTAREIEGRYTRYQAFLQKRARRSDVFR